MSETTASPFITVGARLELDMVKNSFTRRTQRVPSHRFAKPQPRRQLSKNTRKAARFCTWPRTVTLPPANSRRFFRVGDAETAALMKLFYHGLWKEKKTPLDALRDAQLSIYHHPHRILQRAQSRGAKFEKYAKLVKKPPIGPHVKSAPRLWAAFILAGAGM